MFPAFRPFFGASTAEVNKLAWWTPSPDREASIRMLAQRIAGPRAADKLRDAWKATSEAIECSPLVPSYYIGPWYLGPMQPMCADASARVLEFFDGLYLFRAESKDENGLTRRPTYVTRPRGKVPLSTDYYRRMRDAMARAAKDIEEARPHVDARHRLMFDAEATPIMWLYHTARTQAAFYESCQLRDVLVRKAAGAALGPEERSTAREQLAHWRQVLTDELENSTAALPVLKSDMQLDPYLGYGHNFSHGDEMLQAKIALL